MYEFLKCLCFVLTKKLQNFYIQEFTILIKKCVAKYHIHFMNNDQEHYTRLMTVEVVGFIHNKMSDFQELMRNLKVKITI